MSDITIPEGFKLFPVDGTFNDAIAPMVYRITETEVICGFQVSKKHSNPMGMCHGGALMSLLDFSLSAGVCHKIGVFSGTPTISLSFDFMSRAMIGDWIFAEVEALKITNTMGFVQGLIKRENGDLLVRASGTFKLPKEGAQAGVSVEDFILQNEKPR